MVYFAMIHLARYIYRITIFVVLIVMVTTSVGATDLLDVAYEQSRAFDQIINIGSNKNAVGNEIFRGSANINASLNNWISVTEQAPLLVRITQTLLRFTVALSIPILIWIGVKTIAKWLSSWDIKWAIKEVSGVLIGLALALSAVGILYLIQSIALHTLQLYS